MSNDLESGIQSYNVITNNRKNTRSTRRTHRKRPKQNFSDIHGNLLGTKDDGDVRIIRENWDSISPWQPRNDKIIVARHFIHHLQDDAYLGAECRAQCGMLPNDNSNIIVCSMRPYYIMHYP